MIISFTKTKLPYGWLGNMAPYPIVYKDKYWRTTEALFQALRFESEAIIEVIRAEKSPMSAKMAAKKHKDLMVVEPQSPADLENMRLVLRLKVKQHPELQNRLCALKNTLIVEDCTSRPHGSGLFWGAAKNDLGWTGENWLGKMWMELRDRLLTQGDQALSDV